MALLPLLSLLFLAIGMVLGLCYIIISLRSRPKGTPWNESVEPSGKLKALAITAWGFFLLSIFLPIFI